MQVAKTPVVNKEQTAKASSVKKPPAQQSSSEDSDSDSEAPPPTVRMKDCVVSLNAENFQAKKSPVVNKEQKTKVENVKKKPAKQSLSSDDSDSDEAPPPSKVRM